MDNTSAAAALARAANLRASVEHGSRWLIRYQLVYGAAAFISVLLLGLISGPAGVAVSTGVWVVTIILLSVYAVRQPVAHRGMGLRHGIMIGSWALIYSAVLVPGITWFEGELAWWLPGAVAVAVPALLMAYLTARRAARR
ncbi:hypothetical protein [Actinomadura sp. 9N407]|uniref:hypothetical protein n=1 Tax=Actinomadura sp. 9N407 TaxID=3375154 RepID=UPI00379805D1